MASSALIHIGLGKTGSSSVQRALAGLALAGTRVSYPDLGIGESHNRLVMLYRDYDRLSRGLKAAHADPTERASFVASLRDRFKARLRDEDAVILSGEFLSDLEPAGIAALGADLAAEGVTAPRVICYLREPTSLYLSRLQQAVKHSDMMEDPQTVHFRFIETLSNWRAGIDPAPIVRPYSRGQLRDGDVVEDFLHEAEQVFGTPLPRPEARVRVNETLSAEGMILLHRLAERAPFERTAEGIRNSTARVRVVERVSREFGSSLTPPRLRPEVVARLRETHAADLAALKADYGVEFEPPAPARRQRWLPRFGAVASPLSDILADHDPRAFRKLEAETMRRLEKQGLA